jgi:hypothetical protein
MTAPVSSFDTDAIIELITKQTQTTSNISTGNQITINNVGNLAVKPELSLIANGAITSITVTNSTNGRSVGCVTPLAQNDVLTIKNDMVFKNGTEVSATFNAPFQLDENVNNVLQFDIVGGNTINIDIAFEKPSGIQHTQSFLQGFSLTENRAYQKQNNGTISLYSKDAKLISVGYSFSIDQMWYQDDIFSDNPESVYRITYQAQANDIDSKTIYLCGCRFENLGISQQEEGMVKYSLSGFALRRF